MTREVWITGVGVISAAGIGTARLAAALECGVSALSEEPAVQGWTGHAPDPPASRTARRLDRSARFFLCAGEEAWRDSGLDHTTLDPERVAVLEGSSLGPLSDLLLDLRAGRGARASSLIRCMTGAGGSVLAQQLRVTGPVLHLSAGSVSAACAIADGWNRVRSGEIDIAVVGGSECPLAPEVLQSFAAAGVLAHGTGQAALCRPFDAGRTGTALGEGAGVLILEDADHARRRKAHPRGILLGAATATEVSDSLVAPDPRGSGVQRAVARVLGPLAIERIGWVKAHGTGTRLNDAAEIRGLGAVFGRRMEEMPVTAFKPALGHTLGASGAVEAVAALLCLEAGFVPAILGLETIDPDLGALRIPRTRITAPPGPAVLLSQSFGGRCGALLVAA